MRYAIVIENVVVNVAVADAPLASTWMPLPSPDLDHVDAGYVYHPGTNIFTRPENPLGPAELREIEIKSGIKT